MDKLDKLDKLVKRVTIVKVSGENREAKVVYESEREDDGDDRLSRQHVRQEADAPDGPV